MHRSLLRTALIVSALLWPFGAVAASPATVTGLSARLENGQVHVAWQMPEEVADISAFRIYYGQKSILENGGAYDDFVTVGARLTRFILTDFPPYPELFLAITAVNAAGEENASFTEEISISLNEVAADGVLHTRVETLGLLASESTSPTQFVLTFSAPVHVPQDAGAEAIAVVDSEGSPLRILRIVVNGSRVTMETAPQTPGKRYNVQVGQVVQGVTDTGEFLELDVGRSQGAFTGFSDRAPGQNEYDVRDLRIIVHPMERGLSNIAVAWEPPAAGSVAHYRVTLSIPGIIDGTPQEVSPDVRVARFSDVPGNTFIVTVQAVGTDGTLSFGATVTSGTPSGAALPIASITTSPPGEGLPRSGIGTLGVALVSMAYAGWRIRRGKRRLAA